MNTQLAIINPRKSLDFPTPQNRYGLLIGAALLFALAALGGLLFALLDWDFSFSFAYVYLWPWVILVSVVIAAPSIYLAVRRRFDLFHPLVYASWSSFAPAFVLGSIFLLFGLSDPTFLYLVPDQRYYLPLTLVYVAIGFAALTAGMSIPYAKRIGVALSRWVPAWDWHPADLLFPCGLLLVIGQVFILVAFSAGTIGYQRADTVESFDTTISSLGSLVSMASFLLWFSIFRLKRAPFRYKLVGLLLLALIPYSTALSGSRGGLLQSTIPIAMAYWLSGRRIKVRHGLVLTLVITIALLVGMVYGSTFRYIKGTEEQTSLGQYFDISAKTLDVIGSRSLADNLSFGFERLSERLETTSSFAVVVANYEQLKPFEADYGLEDNIWTYTWTAFIPRFVWPDKPIISDARSYSALYFDFGESSFAMTPMGDLLRNFGPSGIPIGMALLGFILRILYAALVEDQRPSPWRAVCYYLLLINVSYESFYGTILPSLIRSGVIIVLGGLLINALVRRRIA